MPRRLVYLDVCALSRPFDDQAFLRIRLETEAVNLIMTKVREGYLKLAVSPAHFVEIRAIPDTLDRVKLLSIVEQFGVMLDIDKRHVRKRAERLIAWGFGLADAAHVAFAEAGRACFITCDDRLLKKCANQAIETWCGSPVSFCTEEDLR